MKLNLTLSAALLATTAPVYAQDIIELDEITVTAGYTDTNISDTGASVSVLQSDDLQNATTSIVQTFENVPGVSLSASGGLGTQTYITVRGLNQNYVAVRVDGMDVTDPSGTQVAYDFGGLNAMGFGQAEFLKGSQSAIFGSEAVAGVVNLKSLASNELGERGSLTFETGSYGTVAANLSFEKVSEQGSAAISLSHVETDGFSAQKTGAGKDEADPYSGDQLRVAVDHSLSDGVHMSFSMLKSSEDIHYDGPFSPLIDTTLRDTSVMRGAVGFDVGTTTHEIAIVRGQFDREYWFGNYDSSRFDIEYRGQSQIGATLLNFGASKSEEDIDAVGEVGSDHETALFVEANTNVFDALNVSAAARQTKSGDFGSNTSYRIAGVYSLSDTLTLRATASTGFRAPSLYERYGSGGSTDFKVEESQTQEIGIEHTYGNGSAVRATLFNSAIKNLIDYDNTTYSYVQADKTRKAKGIELSGQWVVTDRITVGGSYTYTDAKNGSDTAARVPGHDIAVNVDAQLTAKANASLSVNHIMDYTDLVAGSVVDMPDYTVVNLTASYDVTDTLQGYVRVQNLMDSDYETIADFNTGGRQMFAGVRASF